jgi:integral membrane protein
MSALRSLRVYGFLEGISLLFLLLVAMPLKYLFHLPLAVRIAGGVHGLLFLLFVSAVCRASTERGWTARRTLMMLGAAFVPGGTLALDSSLEREPHQ